MAHFTPSFFWHLHVGRSHHPGLTCFRSRAGPCFASEGLSFCLLGIFLGNYRGRLSQNVLSHVQRLGRLEDLFPSTEVKGPELQGHFCREDDVDLGVSDLLTYTGIEQKMNLNTFFARGMR